MGELLFIWCWHLHLMDYRNSWERQLWALPWATNHWFGAFSSRRGENRVGFSKTEKSNAFSRLGFVSVGVWCAAGGSKWQNPAHAGWLFIVNAVQFWLWVEKGDYWYVWRGLFLQELHPSQGQRVLRIWEVIWCGGESSLLILIIFSK